MANTEINSNFNEEEKLTHNTENNATVEPEILEIKNLYDVENEEEEAQQRPFNKGVFGRMIRYGLPYRRDLVIAGLLIIMRAIVSVCEPLLLAYAINEGIGKGNRTIIYNLGGLLLLLTLISLFSGRMQLLLLGRTGQAILYDVRRELFAHIQTLSFDFFDSRPVGKILARLTSDVERISEVINTGIINIITQILSLVFILIFMFLLNVQLALRAVMLLPFIILFIWAQRGPLESLWMGSRRAFSNLTAHINETVTGMTIIQAFSREKINAEKFEKLNQTIRKTYMKPITLELISWPLIELIYALANGLILWYGASEMIAGRIDAGTIVAFIAYQNKFWSPITTFARYYSQMLSAMASAERVFEFLDYPALIDDQPGAIILPPIKGKVTFDQVNFAYQPDRLILKQVSFHVEPGMNIALVGPTGAGKSTIINLIARFYDPASGTVSIDGYDLKQVHVSSLRSQLGIVLQDSFIFSGTIRENIAYARPDADLDEVIAAAKAARAHDFIIKLKDGYDTLTGERGASLSLGQRQLLSFARAILAKPRILILDEATSSIDTETEQLIQEAMANLMQDRTSFIIAHRLATIRHADLIIVVDDGCIKEIGKHEELLAKEGIYWRLHETQFKLREQFFNDIVSGVEE